MMLLAFRMTKHYWRLVLRQLVLPIGASGESLPYRSRYVSRLGAGSDEDGLICGKFDVEDRADRGVSIYVPFRFVHGVRKAVISGSTVTYFNYVLGPTADYHDTPWNGYSNAIRQAVLANMAQEGTEGPDDDRVLVTRIRYEKPALDAAAEIDRWITLTRMLASQTVYQNITNGIDMRRRFSRVVYLRVAVVETIHRPTALAGQAGVGDLRYERPIIRGLMTAPSGHEIGLNVMSNVDPEAPDQLQPLAYRVNASEAYFEGIDDVTEITPGILTHRFFLRARRVFGGTTHLRLAPAGDARGFYAPDIVIPIELRSSWRLLGRLAGAALIVVGLGLSYVGLLPDGDMMGMVRHFRIIPDGVSLDAVRWWVRSTALTLTSSGIGLSLFQRA